jgi:hypothetical protein
MFQNYFLNTKNQYWQHARLNVLASVLWKYGFSGIQSHVHLEILTDVSSELSAFIIGVIQEEWHFDKNEIQIINRFTLTLVNASKWEYSVWVKTAASCFMAAFSFMCVQNVSEGSAAFILIVTAFKIANIICELSVNTPRLRMSEKLRLVLV